MLGFLKFRSMELQLWNSSLSVMLTWPKQILICIFLLKCYLKKGADIPHREHVREAKILALHSDELINRHTLRAWEELLLILCALLKPCRVIEFSSRSQRQQQFCPSKSDKVYWKIQAGNSFDTFSNVSDFFFSEQGHIGRKRNMEDKASMM